VQEYMIDLNATQAAIRAGYSAKTAEEQGYQLLRKTSVSQAVQVALDARARRTGITADRVLQELAKLAYANLQDFYQANGSLKEIANLPPEVAVALSSIKVNLTEGCAIQEVKLHDKVRCLELIGKHLKLFTEKVELGGEVALSGVLRVPDVSPEAWAEMAKPK